MHLWSLQRSHLWCDGLSANRVCLLSRPLSSVAVPPLKTSCLWVTPAVDSWSYLCAPLGAMVAVPPACLGSRHPCRGCQSQWLSIPIAPCCELGVTLVTPWRLAILLPPYAVLLWVDLADDLARFGAPVHSVAPPFPGSGLLRLWVRLRSILQPWHGWCLRPHLPVPGSFCLSALADG